MLEPTDETQSSMSVPILVSKLQHGKRYRELDEPKTKDMKQGNYPRQ